MEFHWFPTKIHKERILPTYLNIIHSLPISKTSIPDTEIKSLHKIDPSISHWIYSTFHKEIILCCIVFCKSNNEVEKMIKSQALIHNGNKTTIFCFQKGYRYIGNTVNNFTCMVPTLRIRFFLCEAFLWSFYFVLTILSCFLNLFENTPYFRCFTIS